MTTFTTEELVSSTNLVKNFWIYSEKINSWELDKIWVLKNNKLKLTIIPTETFSYYQDLAENLEIYKEIIDRQNKNDFVDADSILSKFNLSVN